MLSSGAGHLYPAGDDLLLELLETSVHAVGNEILVSIVVHVADTALGKAERVDAAFESLVLNTLNRVEDRRVDAFYHRRQNVSWSFIILIGIDSNRELVHCASRFENSLPGGTGCME